MMKVATGSRRNHPNPTHHSRRKKRVPAARRKPAANRSSLRYRSMVCRRADSRLLYSGDGSGFTGHCQHSTSCTLTFPLPPAKAVRPLNCSWINDIDSPCRFSVGRGADLPPAPVFFSWHLLKPLTRLQSAVRVTLIPPSLTAAT